MIIIKIRGRQGQQKCCLKSEFSFFKIFIVYVVVNFLSQVIFVFLLFLGMLMYANEVKTKGKIKITGDKKLTTTCIFHLNYFYQMWANSPGVEYPRTILSKFRKKKKMLRLLDYVLYKA